MTDTQFSNPLFSTLAQLPPDATLSEVFAACGDQPISFGVAAEVFALAGEYGKNALKNLISDLVHANPGSSLSRIQELSGLPKDRISSLITSMLGEENPRIMRFGAKRAAVYFPLGGEINDTQVQELILSTLGSGEPAARPEILKNCEDPQISQRRVLQNLQVLVDQGKVLQTGRARGMRFQIPVSGQPETDPTLSA